MNDKFDELARNMAQCITRRGALKKFGVGLAGIVLAVLGLRSPASAQSTTHKIQCKHVVEDCAHLYPSGSPEYQACVANCSIVCSQGSKFCLIG